ncbi:MAG: FecR domain-containing protein [Gammaproteobacteria bacterium]
MAHPLSAVGDAREVARHWVARLASREMSEDELREFRSWHGASIRNSDAFRDERNRWAALENTQGVFQRSIAADKWRSRRIRAVWTSLGAAAATAAVAVVLLVNPFVGAFADYATHLGEVRTIDLRDGSQAWLNSGTALDLAYSDAERRVQLLEGEAWFKVRHAPEQPFVVAAGGVEVTARGTAFSVARGAGGDVSLKVTEGVVVVSRHGTPIMDVRAGEGVDFAAGERRPEMHSFREADALAWRDRKLVLAGVTLEEAAARINRYRRGHVLFWAAPEQKHVGAILTFDRLDEGLDALATSQGHSVLHLTPWLAIVR